MKALISILMSILWIICVCGVPGFAAEPNQAAKNQQATKDGLSPALIEKLGCTSFRWWTAPGQPEKTAVVVPIVLDGKQYWFQLDTGSDATLVYGAEAQKRGWKRWSDYHVRVPNGAIGGMKLSSFLISPKPQRQASAEVTQGTLGLDLLIGNMVVLDFPGRHFCMIPRADFPGLPGTSWVPAEVRGGKLYVPLSLNSEKLDGVFFDTGSSAEGLDVDLALWKKLTGRNSEKDATFRFTGPSWGKTIELIAAPASGELKIGKLSFAPPMIFTEPATPTSYSDTGRRGLLGNATFFSDIVILDLGLYPGFGVLVPQRQN